MDCTGHGVPGAFMSMVGNEHLNEVVTYLNIEEPHQVLNELHASVRNSLKQDATGRRDGMDMGFCTIDQEIKRLHYSGAKMPLVYIRKGKLHVIEADPHPIGGYQRESYHTFTKHIIDVMPGDMFYLYSDGFQDQFGGANGKKMLSKNFKQLLLSIHHLPMFEQKAQLEQAFNQWKGDERQIDDVMVLGFKI
jgi:serine phosphatase RsbU (regulator of sigma subunit)